MSLSVTSPLTLWISMSPEMPLHTTSPPKEVRTKIAVLRGTVIRKSAPRPIWSIESRVTTLSFSPSEKLEASVSTRKPSARVWRLAGRASERTLTSLVSAPWSRNSPEVTLIRSVPGLAGSENLMVVVSSAARAAVSSMKARNVAKTKERKSRVGCMMK